MDGSLTAPRRTCDHCGQLIGVYEPTVLVIDGQARETSRAAEPSVAFSSGRFYHRACYIEAFDARDADGNRPHIRANP